MPWLLDPSLFHSERKNDQLADQEDELKQAKVALQKMHHEVHVLYMYV